MIRLNRNDVIEVLGLEVVEQLDRENAEPTSRATDDGTVEFAAGVWTQDAVRVVAYYYQPAEAVAACENLDELDWSIDHYKIV